MLLFSTFWQCSTGFRLRCCVPVRPLGIRPLSLCYPDLAVALRLVCRMSSNARCSSSCPARAPHGRMARSRSGGGGRSHMGGRSRSMPMMFFDIHGRTLNAWSMRFQIGNALSGMCGCFDFRQARSSAGHPACCQHRVGLKLRRFAMLRWAATACSCTAGLVAASFLPPGGPREVQIGRTSLKSNVRTWICSPWARPVQ